jgi:hypothetical protein
VSGQVENNHPKEIQIPVIQIRTEGIRTVLDKEGNVVEETCESRETQWLATTTPPKPLRVKEEIKANGLTSEAEVSVGGKARRKRKPNLSPFSSFF